MDLLELTSKRRKMAAEFIALADANGAHIMTSDLYTQNFVTAFGYAEHMVRGGAYSGGESQLVFNQLSKLKRHFGT